MRTHHTSVREKASYLSGFHFKLFHRDCTRALVKAMINIIINNYAKTFL